MIRDKRRFFDRNFKNHTVDGERQDPKPNYTPGKYYILEAEVPDAFSEKKVAQVCFVKYGFDYNNWEYGFYLNAADGGGFMPERAIDCEPYPVTAVRKD